MDGQLVEVKRIYQAQGSDPTFADVLRRVTTADEMALAELIETDGRVRLNLNRPVLLRRYLEALPDLAERPDPLDAAIDMSLRWLARTGEPTLHSVDSLASAHPELESAIREAAALSAAIVSTNQIQRRFASRPDSRSLPAEFGLQMDDGTSRYLLDERLGQGAFGQVYRAVDRKLSEDGHQALVAIKIFTCAKRTPWQRQRMTEEATKARRIDHPAVVRVLDRGVSNENEDFIVYEFVDGGDLGRWKRRHRELSVPDVCRLLAQIARGVHAAHMAGLVHLDLKPPNIMLTSEGQPKVADFGVAIRSGESAPVRESEAAPGPIGNLAFISPEQYRGEPGGLTVPSDIYALGGILFWLLSGELPNGDNAETIEANHDRRLGRTEPPRIPEHRSGVDRDLQAICRRAMAINPAARYPSAAALADDLERWIRHEPIVWTKPSTMRRGHLWVRRKPKLAAALFTIVLLSVGGLVALGKLNEAVRKQRFEESVRDAARERLRGYAEDLKVAKTKGPANALLPHVWFLEWMYGTTVLGENEDRGALWPQRIRIIRTDLADLRQQGLGDSLEARLWETALAFWLIATGEPEEATQLLKGNERWWRDLLPGDPILDQLSRMQLCAEAMEAVSPPANTGTPGSSSQVEPLAATLEDHQAQLAESGYATPVHLLVVAALIELNGPGGLDRPTRVEALNQLQKELDDAVSIRSEDRKKKKQSRPKQTTM